MESIFDLDTAVTPEGDCRFGATLTDRWDRLGGGPLGGYTLATCLRALAASMPQPEPIVASAFFLRPASHGRAEISTELLRAGRTIATGAARLVQGDREVLRVVASFADPATATGRTLVLNDPPTLPPIEHCVDPLASMILPGVTVADRVEYRFASPPGWQSGAPTGSPSAECWLRFRDDRPADALALAFVVDAVAPAVMEIGAAGSSTLELTVHFRQRPEPGWLRCRLGTRHVINGFHEEDFEVWDAAGQLVAQSRQLAVLPA